LTDGSKGDARRKQEPRILKSFHDSKKQSREEKKSFLAGDRRKVKGGTGEKGGEHGQWDTSGFP